MDNGNIYSYNRFRYVPFRNFRRGDDGDDANPNCSLYDENRQRPQAAYSEEVG